MTYFTVAGLQLALDGDNNLDQIRQEVTSLSLAVPVSMHHLR